MEWITHNNLCSPLGLPWRLCYCVSFVGLNKITAAPGHGNSYVLPLLEWFGKIFIINLFQVWKKSCKWYLYPGDTAPMYYWLSVLYRKDFSHCHTYTYIPQNSQIICHAAVSKHLLFKGRTVNTNLALWHAVSLSHRGMLLSLCLYRRLEMCWGKTPD